MSNHLHHNAALRVLRREMVRLDDGKAEMVASINDPRIPAGVVLDQIQQSDREMAELRDAHGLLDRFLDRSETFLGIAAE